MNDFPNYYTIFHSEMQESVVQYSEKKEKYFSHFSYGKDQFMEQYRIGVDLGGTNIAAGIVDDHYRILHKGSVKTALPRPAEAICQDIDGLCRRLCEEAGISFDDIEAIGIGSPGSISRGVVKRAGNLGFRNVPLADMVSALTNKPVSLKNDANAAALGELIAGSGKQCSSLIAVTLGTGVGGGIVLDGKIVEGFCGAGGEVGHIVVSPNGLPCTCGNRGCLEAYCSATALIQATKEAMIAHPESLLNTLATPDTVNGKTAFDGMRAGDPAATEVVDTFITMLSYGVVSMIRTIQPEVICIGGGLSKEGETLLAPLRDKVWAQIRCDTEEARTKLVVATLGNDAGIIGAAG